MTSDEANQLEREFNIIFPAWYRAAVTDHFPFEQPGEEFTNVVEDLRISNQGCRKSDPWGFKWQDHFWWIGDDGSGGFYFIDTSESDSTIYSFDHEAPARSMNDREKLVPQTFDDFVNEVLSAEEDFARWEIAMRAKVAARKWWQIWIPREWPPRRKH